MAKLVSKVYGDALFEEAMEKNQVSEWYEEAGALLSIFAENPKFMELLNHPQLGKEEKIQVAESVFSGRISEGMAGFLSVALEKGRQKSIPEILEYFADRVKEYKKIGVVYVGSAVPLSGEQKEKIERRVLGTTDYVSLEPHYQVDETLIGGLVIRIGGRVADSSIRTRLENLRRELSKIQLV